MLGVVLRLDRIVLDRVVSFAVLILALYLCGYYRPQGWYAWFAVIPLSELSLRILVATLGGFLLLIVFATQNVVSRWFNGPVSRMLGQISFALYLLHTLVITSFSAWTYVLAGGGTRGILAAAAALIVITVPLVWALARFDAWWLRRLARWQPAGREMRA